MNIFKELIEVNNQVKTLSVYITKKKEEFEKTLSNELVNLQQLKEKESVLREEIVNTLKQNNENEVIIDNKTIARASRFTLRIEDPALLLAAITHRKEKLESNLGINIDKIMEEAFQTSIDIRADYKPEILNMVQLYKNIEGKLLDGAEEKLTEYITIKENK